MYLSVGHAGFTRGKTYNAYHDGAIYSLECVVHRRLKDDKEEAVVILQDNDITHRHMCFQIGENPDVGTKVYGIGYAGGNFAYAEGSVSGHRNDNRFLTVDVRMMEGASGGALATEDDRLVGILSSRSLLPTERASKGYDPPSTTWIGVVTFKPCVDDYLKSIEKN